MLATIEVLGAKDQLSLALAGSTNDDWLARDYDVDAPVYLFVYPSHASTDPHRSRWSIAWPVGGLTEASMTAWRHIHADAYDNEAGLETDPPRYVYGGAITKTAGPGTLMAKRFMLATMSLPMRRRIEELAAETPLTSIASYPEDDSEDGQGWIKELLNRMVASGVISSATRDHVIQDASAAFVTPHSPLVLHLCE
ncbi:hypothetical protein GY45DRAFT_1315231 [Cubamyces sp. BRFM 1775]|nr:hypothetical protein GY45DRAFT_1315231 [Cubamyces sp. BRFM 1775]